MLFERTRSVHTVGMRFPIVAAFLGPAERRPVNLEQRPEGPIACGGGRDRDDRFEVRRMHEVWQVHEVWRVHRVRRVRAMAPGRLALPRAGVRAVIELPCGSDVRVGDAILCRLPTAGSDARAPIV
jgi:hypothetical protein